MTNLFGGLLALGVLSGLATVAAECGNQEEAREAPRIEVKHVPHEQRVDVVVGGDRFTSYVYTDTLEILKKPVLYPITSPEGTPISRGYPLDPREGERTDHPHQIGLWFNYGDVNGLDFWNNSGAVPTERRDAVGTIRHREIVTTESGAGEGLLVVRAAWLTPEDEPLLDETTRFVFLADPGRRIIDRSTTLNARDERVDFHDNKEGLLGLRLTRALEMPTDTPIKLTDANGNVTNVPVMDNEGVTGKYRNSEGVAGYPDVWGKRARWTALTGVVGDDSVTVAILDHPENAGYPTYWHVRDYGLFAANPLGQEVFSEGERKLNWSLAPGESATFRHRVVIFTGHVPDEEIEDAYVAFTDRD